MLVSPSLPTLPNDVDAALPVSLDAFLAGIGPRAFRFAEAGLRQRDDALDAVQDAMLRMRRSSIATFTNGTTKRPISSRERPSRSRSSSITSNSMPASRCRRHCNA